ncbi:MAG: type 1 periplasmic binding fold superfamily protein [Cytophagaceae bacterium]|nr:type 1 periplasmic binding fold superfamily protein [Cytophagaceae bacterium]|tara:strand:- start:73 stop:660 length:588 start_codon:yes stop_codon:yes gene_type:complete
MKIYKYSILFSILALSLASCSYDTSDFPKVINEEEVITTMEVELAPQGGGDTVMWVSRDLDGDGPQEPQITISGPLRANTTYTGSLELLNETEDPAESINEEIMEEADEHQFFFQVAGLDITTAYADSEADYVSGGGTFPVGLAFVLTTGAASSGNYTITLRHEPAKDAAGVADGDITNAAGETDFAQSFPVSIE